MDAKRFIKLFGVVIYLNDDDDANRRMKRPRLVAPNSQELPQRYRDFVVAKGGDEGSIQLILRKRLTATDLNRNHARLTMPRKMIENSFMRPEEELLIQKYVDGGNRKLKNKLSVMVVDPFTVSNPMSEMRPMKIAMWNYDEKKSSWWLALTSDWMKLLQENQFCVGDAVQIWSFRIHGDLGLIIHEV